MSRGEGGVSPRPQGLRQKIRLSLGVAPGKIWLAQYLQDERSQGLKLLPAGSPLEPQQYVAFRPRPLAVARLLRARSGIAERYSHPAPERNYRHANGLLL